MMSGSKRIERPDAPGPSKRPEVASRAPDWVLLERWQQGHMPAGEELSRRYLGLLSRFFRNKISDRDDVGDLVSDTMLACTRGQPRIRNPKSFRSYVFGTACNQLRRYYQKQSKRALERSDFEQCCVNELDSRPHCSAETQQARNHVMVHSLRSLPLQYQVVLELAMFEDMSGRQIGELLDLPTATVHTQLRRGKQRLTRAMTTVAANPDGWKATATDVEGWAEKLRRRTDRDQ